MEFDVTIEIPKGQRNKYEVDHTTGRIRLDRMLFTATRYPADYGFIDNTLGEDGDPLDALVLLEEPTFPGCVIPVKVIALFRMRDDKGIDDKIVAVNVRDPAVADYTDHSQLPQHVVRELKRFFQDYKVLENKMVEVEDILGPKEALDILRSALDMYRRLRRGEIRSSPRSRPTPVPR